MNAANDPREARRREAIRDYGLLDTPREVAYDDLCRLAAHVCATPIAAISLTDADRLWVKAAVGIGTGSIPRKGALCARVAEAGEAIVVPDASLDARFCSSPLVTGEPGIRFYAGMPLVAPSGVAMGALCVADRVARKLLPAQVEALAVLAREAVAQMELHRRIDESERDRRRLADREEMLRTIFELEPECVKVTSIDGVILRMNPAGLALLEADGVEQVVGRSMVDFVVPADRDRVREAFMRIRDGGTAMVEFEVEGLRGGRRTLESHAVPVREADGTVRSILAVTRDVTARRQAEAALRQKEGELRQAQKMEVVGRMAGGIAHDFNNILTALVGYSEMLLEETPESGPAREHALEVLRGSERAAQLCQRLLAFSRRQPARPEVIDPGAVLVDLEGMLRPILGAKVDLRIILPPEPWFVRADRGQIEQVVVNLAVNARDAMSGGGVLTLELRNGVLGSATEPAPGGLPPGRYSAVSVRDTGTGMSPEIMAHLFEPFFTTKEQGKGTGFGLSTVYGIAKQAGGHVEVRSRVGEGSVVTVYLPAVEPVAKLVPPVVNPGRPDRPESKGILVVEDADDVRHLARRILEGRGYRVFEAANARDALLELASRKAEVRLVVTDVMLGGMTGLELAARVRTACPNVRILVMSGNPEYLEGVGHCIAKPFTPDGLVRAVQAAMGG